MSSTKNKTETKSKVDTCCSEPAKRKLLIKIGVGVAVATVLLIVIIAVAVVMATRGEDTGSNPSVSQSGASNVTTPKGATTVTTVTPPPTTEKARIVSVVTSQLNVDLSSLGSQQLPTREVVALEEDRNIQWIYYEEEDFAVYIIQKFDQNVQTIIATTRGPNDLQNNYNGTILFCEDDKTKGNFLTPTQIQESKPSNNIAVVSSDKSFDAPSVVLPFRTEGCQTLPERLRYKPATQTKQQQVGSICASLLQGDLNSNTSKGTFPGDRCNAKTSMVDECQCYKQCLDCTSHGATPRLPSCRCIQHMQSEASKMSCTDTEDDAACVAQRDRFTEELDGKPCSCLFGVYFAYPCGQTPEGCQGNTCQLKWCYSGFTYKSPAVKFQKMCPISTKAIQCT